MNRVMLATVAEVIAGQSPEGKFYNGAGDGLPFYQGKKDFGDKFIDSPTVWTKQTTKVAREGDILMSVRAPVGPVNFSTEDICIGRGLAAIRGKNGIDRDFLFYQLLYLQPMISGSEGAVFASINKAQIEALPIVAPSLVEQQRIVAILDEAFAGIATAKTNTERNLRNARSLFDSYLQKMFTRSCKGWRQATLGDVCKFVGGSQPPKAVFESEPAPDRVRLVQIRDYKSERHVVYIPRYLARRFCDASEVMIGRYGPPIFQILRGLEGAYNVALMKAVPNESELCRDYLFWFLKHPAILQYVIYHSDRAAGQIGLTKETLEPYPLALPPLEEQNSIVHTISELHLETKRLESLYTRKLTALDELKQSLLQQAFSGQL